MDTISNLCNVIQNFLDTLCSCTFGHSLLNFFAALIIAFISFPIFIYELTTKEEFIGYIKFLSDLKFKIKIYCMIYLIVYALVTGFLAAALIEFQFQGCNVPTAIFYGVIGPFILRKQLFKVVKSGVGEVVSEKVAAIDEKMKDAIVSGMKEIEEDLAKKANIDKME